MSTRFLNTLVEVKAKWDFFLKHILQHAMIIPHDLAENSLNDIIIVYG